MKSLEPIFSQLLAHGQSLISQYRLSDANRPLRLRLSGADGQNTDNALLIKEIQASWHLNQPLKIQVTCLSSTALLSLSPFIGQSLAIDSVTDKGQLFSLTGIITSAKAGQSDGALATYQFIVEDSLCLLRLRRNSRVFLDTSVLDITYTLFNEWLEKNPAFNASIELDTALLQNTHPPLSFCMQSNETDFDFLTRLWQSAGINYWFEPVEPYRPFSLFNATAGNLKHKLVLMDDSSTLQPALTGALAYHRADATESRDSVIAFTGKRSLQPFTVQGMQWLPDSSSTTDASSDSQTASLASSGLVDTLLHTPLHPENPSLLEQQTQLMNLGHALKSKIFEGISTVRDLHIGRWFALKDHPELDANHSADEKEFTVLGLNLIARNNLPKELEARSTALLEQGNLKGFLQGLHLDPQSDQRVINQFKVVRRSVPIVPSFNSLSGTSQWQPKPHVQPMIGVVVGPAGEEVYVDANYRIQVRFPHLQADDHLHQGGRGTNNSEGDSAWIPILSPLAGHQFGLSFIPRIGQTVVIDFLNGDIDRPFVKGVLYDGTHSPAQFSHTGSLPDNRYLSGIVSKEIQSNRTNQLRFDDTPEEIGSQLQSDEQASQLNLGYVTHPRRGQAQHRGTGFELRTDGQGALRAKGLLLSTHAQSQAGGDVMDAKAAQSQLQGNLQAAKALSEVAQNQNADPLNTLDHLQGFIEALESQNEQKANAFKQAVLVLSSPDGISLSTNKSLYAQANQHVTVGANMSINLSAQQDIILHTKNRLSLFAAEEGAKLFAAKGKVEIQAQGDAMELIARKLVKVVSTEDRIEITSPKEIVLIAGGSQIIINARGVFIYTSGVFNPKAAQHKVEGGQKVPVQVPEMPNLKPTFSNKIDLYNLFQWDRLDDISYKFKREDGSYTIGKLDEHGRTARITRSKQEKVSVLVGHTSQLWHIETESFQPFDDASDEGNNYNDDGQ